MLCFMVISAILLSMHALAVTSPSPGKVLSNEPHVYSVTPASEEWLKMSIEERFASCRVSEAKVSKMTTEALILTVINYPFLINMYAYNSIEIGIKKVSNHCPGLPELLSREDAVEELTAYIESAKTRGAKNTDRDMIDSNTLLNLLSSAENSTRAHRDPTDSVLTPMRNPVYGYIGLNWVDAPDTIYYTEEAVEQTNIAYMNTYNVTSIGPYTCLYNCGSYALHIASTSNNFWLETPSTYFTDTSYVPAAGGYTNTRITYASGNDISTIAHVGIVSSASEGDITSKWGPHGLFIHGIIECPYYVDEYLNPVLKYWTR